MANALLLCGVLASFVPLLFLDLSHVTQLDYLLYGIPAGLGGVLLIWGILSIINWSRARKVTSNCIGVERAVQLSFERDTDFVTLTFTDDRYADRFAAINADSRTY
jgi:hypothetical protein